jgi:prepilin-type N-terminal cleavage/methylation domain-containing protein
MKRRSGFTLVELVIVVAIIGVLMALLIPAIQRVRYATRVAATSTEIHQLAAAITNFRTRYGITPPSQFVVYITEAGWNSDPANKATARRLWPQFDFKMDGGAGTKFPSTWAVDQKMNAGECLLFFLGGAVENRQPTGFSKDPAHPFAPNRNREPPFIEFDINRIRDSDGNKIPEYFDAFNAGDVPYLYYSSYDGRGYAPAELCCGMTDFYRAPNAGKPYMGSSFQIISPGIDGLVGNGGEWDSENPGISLATGRPTSGLNAGGAAERDNITNFSNGLLLK